MTPGFSELVVGDVLVAPFVAYALAALAVFLLTRPLLRLFAFDRIFANPALAGLSLYAIILAVLVTMCR